MVQHKKISAVRPSLYSGFTLIELIMVGIILALLLSAGVELYRNYETERQRRVTTERIATVTRALEDYFSVDGAYPCPSTLGSTPLKPELQGAQTACATMATDVPNNTCSADPETLVCAQAASRATESNRVIIGAIPFRSLPIREDDTFDGYGSRLYYAVSQDLTQPSKFKLENAGIKVIDRAGADVVLPPGGARYVVFSVGPNRVGGYNAQGVVSVPCDDATYTGIDYKNCDFLDGGGSAEFIHEQIYKAGGTNSQDDVLAFESYSSEASVIGWRRGDSDAGEDEADLIMPFRNVMVGSLTKSVDAAMAVFGTSGGVSARGGRMRADQICDENDVCFAVSELVRTCPPGEYVTGIGKGQVIADSGGASTRVYCRPIQVGCPDDGKVMAGIDPATNTAKCVDVVGPIPPGDGLPPGGIDTSDPISKYCVDNPTDPVCKATGDYHEWVCSLPGQGSEPMCQNVGGIVKIKCIKITGDAAECQTKGDAACAFNPDNPICLPATEGFCYYNPDDPRCSGQSDGDGVCEKGEACYGDGGGDTDGDGKCEIGEPCLGDDGGGDEECDNLEYCFGGGDDGDGKCEVNEACYGDGSGDQDGDGICESGEDCFDDSDGVCETGEACYGGGGGDQDGDGTCEVGEACYTDDDGICEINEACYGDGSGDGDKDGICETGEDCFGDDAPGVGSDGCLSGAGKDSPPIECTAAELETQGEMDPAKVDFRYLTRITNAETSDPSQQGTTRYFTIKKMTVCKDDGSSEEVVTSNTALNKCCNLPDYTPEWRWFRCNNKTSGNDDNTIGPNDNSDCDGPYYAKDMVQIDSTLLMTNNYVKALEKSYLPYDKVRTEFLRNYNDNRILYSGLVSASSGGCDWNVTEGIVFQVPEFDPSGCGVKWRTVGPGDPKFGLSAGGVAKNILGVTLANPIQLTLSDTSGLSGGDTVYVEGIQGTAELNKKYFLIKAVFAGNKVSLKELGDDDKQKYKTDASGFVAFGDTETADNARDIDGTNFTAWSSGGTLKKASATGPLAGLSPTACYPTAGRFFYGLKSNRDTANQANNKYDGERSCEKIAPPNGGQYMVTGKCRWVKAGTSSTAADPDGVERARITGSMPVNPTLGVLYHPGTCVMGAFQWKQGPTPSGPVLLQKPEGLPEIDKPCAPGSPTSKCWKSLGGNGWQVYNDCPCSAVSQSCVGLDGAGPFPPWMANPGAITSSQNLGAWPTFTSGNYPNP